MGWSTQLALPLIVFLLIFICPTCGHLSTVTPWSPGLAQNFLVQFTHYMAESGAYTAEDIAEIEVIADTIILTMERLTTLGKSSSYILRALNIAFATSVAEVAMLEHGTASLNQKISVIYDALEHAFLQTIGGVNYLFINKMKELINVFTLNKVNEIASYGAGVAAPAVAAPAVAVGEGVYGSYGSAADAAAAATGAGRVAAYGVGAGAAGASAAAAGGNGGYGIGYGRGSAAGAAAAADAAGVSGPGGYLYRHNGIFGDAAGRAAGASASASAEAGGKGVYGAGYGSGSAAGAAASASAGGASVPSGYHYGYNGKYGYHDGAAHAVAEASGEAAAAEGAYSYGTGYGVGTGAVPVAVAPAAAVAPAGVAVAPAGVAVAPAGVAVAPAGVAVAPAVATGLKKFTTVYNSVSRLSSYAAISRVSSAVHFILSHGPLSVTSLSDVFSTILASVSANYLGFTECEVLLETLLEVIVTLFHILSYSNAPSVSDNVAETSSAIATAVANAMG